MHVYNVILPSELVWRICNFVFNERIYLLLFPKLSEHNYNRYLTRFPSGPDGHLEILMADVPAWT